MHQANKELIVGRYYKENRCFCYEAQAVWRICYQPGLQSRTYRQLEVYEQHYNFYGIIQAKGEELYQNKRNRLKTRLKLRQKHKPPHTFTSSRHKGCYFVDIYENYLNQLGQPNSIQQRTTFLLYITIIVMSQTIFDKIIQKQIPASIVFQDEFVIAFRDIAPVAPTHILIIPKDKDGLSGIAKAEERHEAILGKLLLAASKIAKQEQLGHGYRLVINEGAHGGQGVPHLHVHLLGGRQFGWPPGTSL